MHKKPVIDPVAEFSNSVIGNWLVLFTADAAYELRTSLAAVQSTIQLQSSLGRCFTVQLPIVLGETIYPKVEDALRQGGEDNLIRSFYGGRSWFYSRNRRK